MPERAWIFPTTVFLAVWAAGAAVPMATVDEYYLDVATRIVESLMLAMGLRLILSTGRLNLAHVSFMGIGAYTCAALAMKLGLSFWVALPIAGLVAALIALLIGVIVLRLAGAYFFLITYAFLNVVGLFFQSFFTDIFGGASGLVGVPRPDAIHLFGYSLAFQTKLELYRLVLALFLVLGGLLVRLESSRFGLICSGIRQAEPLSASVGVDPLYYKVLAFVIASFVAGLVGAFFAYSQGVVHSTDFNITPMLRLVAYIVVGGIGSVWGPVAGTIGLSVIAEFLRAFQAYELMVYGAVLVLAMLFFPEGFAGALRRFLVGRRAVRA